MTTFFKAAPSVQSRARLLTQSPPAPSAALPSRPAFVTITPPRRFAFARTGLRLLLATDALLFLGTFGLYAVLRASHPEVFRFGSSVLDPRCGALNEIVLVLSSFSMAWAVHCVRSNQRLRLILSLLLTLAGGSIFMGVRAFESTRPLQEGFHWNPGFRTLPEPQRPVAAAPTAIPASAAAAPRVDPARGHELWMATCRACHGLAGEGIPGQGKDIRGSQFIAGKSDKDLLAFVKVGRMPFDKLNTTGIQMPPRGGNPLLKDADLANIIAYVRTFRAPDESAPTAATAAIGAKQEFYIPKSVIPPAPIGPAGLAANWDAARAEQDRQAALLKERPVNAHLFFNLYALITGVHGLNVVAGMLLLGVLALRVMFGQFAGLHRKPFERVGLLWHAVVVIWIALFPLLYLAW